MQQIIFRDYAAALGRWLHRYANPVGNHFWKWHMSVRMALLLALPAMMRASAQVIQRESTFVDSSADRIMAHVAPRNQLTWFVDIMRQTRRAVPQSKLDELADSLAARAILNRPVERGDGMGVPLSPVGLLAWVGDRGLRKGIPYSGALERLIRVHQQASDIDVRTSALAAMLAVVGRDHGLAYLRTVATSNDPTSWYAINILTIDATGGRWFGPTPTTAERGQSEAILRALYGTGQVRNAEAKRFLDEWALRKGYKIG